LKFAGNKIAMKKILLPLVLLQMCISHCEAQTYSSAELDINNIKARFFANGTMFYDASSPNLINGFEAPKGSGKSTIKTGRLWIGGVDDATQLHVAGETYNQNGRDFFPGALTTDGAASCIIGEDSVYNKVWKINKSTIDTFIAVMSGTLIIPGYTIPEVIINWPAHGNVSLGEDYYLAPFGDSDSSGAYEPENGDYPRIRGDQALFFVFNDKCNIHTETGASAIGLEIRGMAYAYNCPQDSAGWNNTVFVHYDIINRGSFTLTNSYVGVWADLDIGDPLDDLIQCDVIRGSFYGLNQSTNDAVYMANPPVQAIAILNGPYQDNNQLDDSIGIGANESLNGLGFQNGVIDDEQLGLSRFITYNNSGINAAQADPVTGTDYYNYLKGNWLDNSPMVYGYNGHTSGGGTIPANFMYPGISDPLGWGTAGTPQAPWAESININEPQSDRRALGSSGPFTMDPGLITPLDIAFVYARNPSGISASIQTINTIIDNMLTGLPYRIGFTYYPDSTSDCFSLINGVNESPEYLKTVLLYPNPAQNKLNISTEEKLTAYSISDISGRIVISGAINNKQHFETEITSLSAGIYYLRLETEKGIAVKKFVKE